MALQASILRTFNLVSSKLLLYNRASPAIVDPLVKGLKQETLQKLKQLKIPEKPKKPLSPYLKFVTEHRKVVIKDNPNLQQRDIIRKCAEDWKTVSSDLKNKYAESFKIELQEYDKKLLTYQSNLTLEQQDALKTVNSEKRDDRKKRKHRKLLKVTNKPKRPATSYMIYLMEQSKLKKVPIKELMAQAKDAWTALPEAEKTKYQNQFLKEKQLYNAALLQWEEKMIKEGHEELVRAKTLQERIPSRIRHVKKHNPQ